MGNSNRRASPRPSQTGAVWDEANVLRLISEHKLAPKYGDSTSSTRSFECPICFLDFGILNTVNCCKQHICTDCFVQVKGTTGKGACPFCGNAELNASLLPVEKKKSPSTPGNNNSTLNSTKDTDDRRSSIASETDRSSGGSTKALSYTTPEQEKKLRSYSLDDTTPSNGKGPNGSNGHTASKNDREALERQIREQRLQFDERDLAEATARSARSNRSASQGSAMYFRQAVRSRYGTAPNSTGSPFGAYLSSRSVDERTTGSDSATANSPGILDRTANSANRSNTGNIQFMSSLEGLLQTHGSTRITSIEQLEDIMLMEAIRLSMQETTPSTSDSTNNNATTNTTANNQSTSPASRSPAHASPFAPLSPARSGSLRSTPIGRTTTSANSPFRAFATSSGIQAGVNGDEEVRSSEDSGEGGDSQDGEDDYDQEEGGDESQEYRYNQTRVVGRYRESVREEEGEEEEEDLDEEEEQIRLAMELSLADMRAAPSSTDNDGNNSTSTTVNGASVYTADTNAMNMNAASSIDTAYMDPYDSIMHSNTAIDHDHSRKITTNQTLPAEELVLKPHAEDTLPTAASSDALEMESDTFNTSNTTKTKNTTSNNDDTTVASVNSKEDATVSPQAVFAEVRL
uniref:RING-type domain-containing protein n=1 Tax=Spumella elongata TaxID=89044 RepID=A0A7S3H4M4_9STRA|mmetsp:Transcript_34688/g.59782  ORF Transcript_34688/g.59782 Transcript_34688/m.59782 type:complete len:631 (+) Transcript_34688:211-2103(+)